MPRREARTWAGGRRREPRTGEESESPASRESEEGREKLGKGRDREPRPGTPRRESGARSGARPGGKGGSNLDPRRGLEAQGGNCDLDVGKNYFFSPPR